MSGAVDPAALLDQSLIRVLGDLVDPKDEAFLRDCYRQQWLNGAFESACLVPCEGSPEGRNRLLSILQDAGCTRTRPF